MKIHTNNTVEQKNQVNENKDIIITWCGRPITGMNKEELIEVIEYLNSEIQKIQEENERWERTGDPYKYLMDNKNNS